MEVILLERVENLGAIGEVVKVKNGFARNYLLPQHKALLATDANKARFERERAAIEARNAKAAPRPKTERHRLRWRVVHPDPSGRRNRSALRFCRRARHRRSCRYAKGHKIERRHVVLNSPIKTIGLHEITIRLHPEVSFKLTVNVARSPDEAERQAKGENVIAAGQAADKAADVEAAQEIAAAAQAAGFDRGPIDG
jgi:large subunit ribosomal protein L9